MVQFRESARGQAILDKANDIYTYFDDGDVSVDDGTYLYHNGEDGYWLMGWCFVADHDLVSDSESDLEDGKQDDVDPPVIQHAD